MTTPNGQAGVQLQAAPLPPAMAITLTSPTAGAPLITTACILWAATISQVSTLAVRAMLTSGVGAGGQQIVNVAVPASDTVAIDLGTAGVYCPNGLYAGGGLSTVVIVVYVTPILPG